MTEQWYKIPSFPDYEMTDLSMKVRRIGSEHELKLIDGSYSLRAEGKSYMRSAKTLHTTTFDSPFTVDNRKYRIIPEFSNYEITEDGIVRHRRSHRELKEQTPASGGSHYNLWVDGANKSRSTWSLICSAWPEIGALPSKWREIPGFPNYRMDKDGNIQNRKQSKFIREWTGSGRTEPEVRLYKNNKYHWFKVYELMDQIWPEESEDKNAA